MGKPDRNRKPSEVQVRADKRERCYWVAMTYNNGERGYRVALKPSTERYDFEVHSVERTHGPQVTDERFIIGAHAKRELMAWFKRELSLEVTHVTLAAQERLEIAFAVTVLHYERTAGHPLSNLGSLSFEDLHELGKLVKKLNDGVRDAKVEQRDHKHEPSADYFQQLKRDALTKMGVFEAKRDFYSSVLTRHFAWKSGKVPENIYKEGKQFLQLLKLAWATTKHNT